MAIQKNGNKIYVTVNGNVIDSLRIEGKWLISNSTNEVVGKNW